MFRNLSFVLHVWELHRFYRFASVLLVCISFHRVTILPDAWDMLERSPGIVRGRQSCSPTYWATLRTVTIACIQSTLEGYSGGFARTLDIWITSVAACRTSHLHWRRAVIRQSIYIILLQNNVFAYINIIIGGKKFLASFWFAKYIMDSSSDMSICQLFTAVLSSPYLKLKWASSPYAKWDPSGRFDGETAQFRYSKICYSHLRDYMGVSLNWQPSWKASENSLLKSPSAPCTLPRPPPFGIPGWNSRTRVQYHRAQIKRNQ